MQIIHTTIRTHSARRIRVHPRLGFAVGRPPRATVDDVANRPRLKGLFVSRSCTKQCWNASGCTFLGRERASRTVTISPTSTRAAALLVIKYCSLVCPTETRGVTTNDETLWSCFVTIIDVRLFFPQIGERLAVSKSGIWRRFSVGYGPRDSLFEHLETTFPLDDGADGRSCDRDCLLRCLRACLVPRSGLGLLQESRSCGWSYTSICSVA